MNSSRTKNAIINLIAGLSYQIFNVLIKLISRTVFIYFLGKGYLGINSLFSNILSVLSLAELGVGSALIYSMYKPLATKDYNKLAQLTNYYKILYHRIALIVFVVGILIVPFLPYIINLNENINHVTFYYILFLCNTTVSYLFVYKTSILTADQKEYKIRMYRLIIELFQLIAQCIVLIIAKSFELYIILQIVFTIIINVYTAKKVEKMYPFVKKIKTQLPNEEKKNIWTNIKSMFSYKIGGIVLNNTDQIYISILVNTETVGLYSNYLMIVNAVSSILSIIFISVKSSIGNLATENDYRKEYEIFRILDIIAFIVYGLCSLCMLIVFNDFLCLWIGESYVLPHQTIILIVITFYMTGFLYPIWCYRETVGLFKETKNILTYASIINIVLSYILGKMIGLSGILLATILARLLTNIWYEPCKLFKNYFKKNALVYYVKQVMNILIIMISYYISLIFSNMLTINSLLLLIITKILVTVIISIIIFSIYLIGTKDIKIIISLIMRLKKIVDYSK